MAESKSLRIAYGEALAELGAENDKIVVLDADLSNATMTNRFLARETATLSSSFLNRQCSPDRWLLAKGRSLSTVGCWGGSRAASRAGPSC